MRRRHRLSIGWRGIEGCPSALLSLVSSDDLPVLAIRPAPVRASFPVARLGCELRRGLRLAALACLAVGRRFAAGGRLTLVRRLVALRRLAVVRRLAAVRRFAGVRFFRDEREVAARFLRFAICCLLSGQAVYQ
jgi:hypothetical protein